MPADDIPNGPVDPARKRGYDAVYAVIQHWPGSAERNAVIWRAVTAYEAVVTPELERLRAILAALDCDNEDGAECPHEAETEQLRAELVGAQGQRDDYRATLKRSTEEHQAELDRRSLLPDKHRETVSVLLGQREEQRQRAEQAEAERDAILTAIYTTRITHIRDAHPTRMHVADCSACQALLALSRDLPARPDDPEQLRNLAEGERQ